MCLSIRIGKSQGAFENLISEQNLERTLMIEHVELAENIRDQITQIESLFCM
jgi:hypothetical protein